MIDVFAHPVLIGILLSLSAGLAIFMGAILASRKIFHRALVEKEFQHAITAFGGGALISAVCFVLLPQSVAAADPLIILLVFALGGIAFMCVDIILAKMKSKASLMLAMMLDFLPEAIVLGVIISSTESAILTAIFITCVIIAQNLPEGYSAFKDMNLKNQSLGAKKLLRMFFVVSLTGPIFFLIGYFIFSEWMQAFSIVTAFCAGGILYLVFEDIAPFSVMKNHRLPPLGAIFGFMVGLAGYLFVPH